MILIQKYDNENLDKIEKNIFEFDPTDEIDMSNVQMEVTRLARNGINKKISKVDITFDERWTYGKTDGWFREYLYNCTASVAKNY